MAVIKSILLFSFIIYYSEVSCQSAEGCDPSPYKTEAAKAAVEEYNKKSNEPTLRKLVASSISVCVTRNEFYKMSFNMVKTDCRKPTTTSPDWCRSDSTNVKSCSDVIVDVQPFKETKYKVTKLGSCRI